MALPKPTIKPEWATNSENDAITGAPNKLEPTGEFKLSGLKREQPLPRAFLNHQFNNIKDWVDYFEQEIAALVIPSSITTLQAVYPVGSYYMSNAATDPATLFGFGVWTRVKGKFMVGLDEADVDFDGVGETGGSKTHTHTNNIVVSGHALTVNELPATTPFTLNSTTAGSNSPTGANVDPLTGDAGVGNVPATNNINWNGGGATHTHGLTGGVQSSSSLPPYRAAYIFFRAS